MKKPIATEERFVSAAGRQLALYAGIALAAVISLMFLLNWLAGLTGSGAMASSGAVDARNKAVTAYLRDEPPQLNSMLATDAISGQILGHVMEGLLRYDQYGDLVPGVAERWEMDGDTITFYLRGNALWNNGTPVTAHDFVFAWTHALLPSTGSQYAFILYAVKNAEKVNNGELPASQLGVQALDNLTLQVTLEAPIAYFDRMVAFVTFLPVNEAFHRTVGDRYGANAAEMLYNGPFVMESWVHGSSIRLQKNPNYWDADRIQLNTINFAYMTSDPNTLLNLFKDGQIVITDLSAQMLEEAMLQRWQLERFMDGTVFYIDFNFRSERLTSNLNLRKALAMSQDSGELVNRVIKLPGYLPGQSLFPVWLEGVEGLFRDEFPAPVYERNIPLAREHLQRALQELGLQRLPPLVLLTSDSPLARMQAEYYQEVFSRNLGIDIVIDAQIFRQRLEKMTSGDFDMVMAGWGPDYNDPLTFGDLYSSWNLNNRGRYASPALDAQVRIAQTSLDRQERMQAFARIQDILHEDVVNIPNYERGLVYVTHPQVRGIVRRVFGAETDFTYAWIEE
jgi:oligopeptide transport system substrate-binding protein